MVLVLAGVDGFRRGLVAYLSELGAFLGGLGLAFLLFEPLGQLVHRGLAVGVTLAGFGAFLVLLALGHGAAHSPVHRGAVWLAARLRPRLTAGQFQAAGVMPAVSAALVASVLGSSVLAALPVAGTRSLVSHSAFGSLVTRTGVLQAPLRQLLEAPAPPRQPQPKVVVSDPTSNPGEDAFYSLRFSASLQTEVDPAAENTMLQQINAARAGADVAPLRMDPMLQQAARGHSLDMYQRRYFSHQTPDGRTPYDRLKAAGARYLTAGENIAFAPDEGQAWDSLMQSPDHRANILNPDFRCVGVGAYRGLGGFEEMFTQDFADCSA